MLNSCIFSCPIHLSALFVYPLVSDAAHMPEVSRFFGILIAIYYRDHAPPHFHAVYGEHEAVVAIESGAVTGYLPTRAMSLGQEWRILRKAELISAWDRAQSGVRLPRIAPLE